MTSINKMNFLNKDITNHILYGKSFTFCLSDSKIISSIHRSPRGNDCWICEHQYCTEYLLSRIEGDYIYFKVKIKDYAHYDNYICNYGNAGISETVLKNIQNEVSNEIKELYAETKWKVNKTTGQLYVFATHIYGDKWEIYEPNEYSIKIKILKL